MAAHNWGEFHCQAQMPLERFEFIQIRMGIPVRILVYAGNRDTAILATDAAYQRILEIDRALSDYDPDSENMQLCTAHPPGTPVPVGPDLFTVLQSAQAVSADSNGCFDVTVGPVVKLWRIARRKKQLPDEEDLRNALAKVGYQSVSLDESARTVTLNRPGMQLDFGAIAKGYAADQAYDVLRSAGIPIALVAAAGDIRIGDPPPGETAWKVEVEDNTRPPGDKTPPVIMTLANQAISTSGDTYQFLEVDGKRYSHIVDPRTGLGLTTPGSVTIIAPTAMQADGLASAVSVLGPVDGLKLIENTAGVAAQLVWLNEQGELRRVRSPNWPSQPGEDPQADRNTDDHNPDHSSHGETKGTEKELPCDAVSEF